jgi:hypothetical protein
MQFLGRQRDAPDTGDAPRAHRQPMAPNPAAEQHRRIAKTDLLDEEERAKYRDIHGGDYRQLLLRILVDLDTPKPTVQTCRGVPTDDKWYTSHA